MKVDLGGDLVLRTALGDVRQQKPRVFQDIGGKQVEVGARYSIVAGNRVSFELAGYDKKRELRIDPVVLVYSTYLGGSSSETPYGIAVDGVGSAYVTGTTSSANFPTQSAYQATSHGSDAFVTKLTPSGDALVYSTYLSGSGGSGGVGIAEDALVSAYVTGWTTSKNFPTQSSYQATHQGGNYDSFVTKLTSAGNALTYSSYLGGGGEDVGQGITVDALGSAYVTGWTTSTNFPTQSAYQATYQGGTTRYGGDAFVRKLTQAGNALVYSTYLGGSSQDRGFGIAVDGFGSAYVTGTTFSTDFPTQSPFQTKSPGRDVEDTFVTKLTPVGDGLVYSTCLGGNVSTLGQGIAVDGGGSAYITGVTYSTNFPTQSAYQATFQGGGSDAFVTKLTPTGNALVYSTYLGGSGSDGGVGIAVDALGSAYLTGFTQSEDFPTQSAYQAKRQGGGGDAFVTKLTPAGNALVYSTYLGGSGFTIGGNGSGIAVDRAGSAYVTGYTNSTDFPTKLPYQASNQGYVDAFVTKLPPLDKIGVAYSGYSMLDLNGNFDWDGPTTDKLISWSTFQASEKPIYGDWNGDGKTKVGVYNNGTWLLDYNGNGVWDGPAIDRAIFWSTGQSSDVPVMGDWNGDGRTKIGIYNNGTWILDYNGNGVWEGPGVDKTIFWSTGQSGEVPVVGDWNGDGKTKIGIYANGTWILEYNGNYVWDGTGTDKLIFFGGAGYRPMVGDWNGSGWTKIGAYHVSGSWAIDYNGNFVWDGTSIDKLTFFGGPDWLPVVGDWSGNGTTKIGAYTGGQWALDYNGNFAWDPPIDRLFSFGAPGQTPIVGKW